MVIQAYMDESGTHDQSPAVATSIVWARKSVWVNWLKDWNRLKKPIDIVHAVDAFNHQGEFRGWTKEKVASWSKPLMATYNKNKLHLCFSGLDLDAYEEFSPLLSDEMKKVLNSPYFWTVQFALTSMCKNIATGNANATIEIVHEENASKAGVQCAFEYVQNLYPGLSMTFRFGTKKDCVPLQAADPIAYYGFRSLKGRDSGKIFQSLDPEGKRSAKKIYDRESMPLLFAQLIPALERFIAKRDERRIGNEQAPHRSPTGTA